MAHPSLLCKRQAGFRTGASYDFAIKRLKCYEAGDSRGSSTIVPPTFACRFCGVSNYGHLLALADEDGKIAIQNTRLKSKRNLLEGFQAHNNAIFDIAWMDEEFKLVSVSGDHTAVLWDVSNAEMKELGKFDAHTRSVKTVAFRPKDKAVFATGGRDGMIMVWDARTARGPRHYKPDNYISNCHHLPGVSAGTASKCKRSKCVLPSSRANSVTALVFQDENTIISGGAGDGQIKIWDLRKNYSAYKRDHMPKHCLQYGGSKSRNGFADLQLDPGHMKLYASCMDNTIYCYNVSSYEDNPVSTYTGHDTGSFYIRTCLSPDGQYLVSGSTDEKAYIWNVNQPARPLTTLAGHYLEVTCVAWCPVGDVQVVTCSDDAHVRYWEVGSEFEEYNEIELRGWTEDIVSPGIIGRSKLRNGIEKLRTPMLHQTSNLVATLEKTPQSHKRYSFQTQRTPDVDSKTPETIVCHSCRGDQIVTPCSKCISGEERTSSIRETVSLKRRLDNALGNETSQGSLCKRRSVLSPVKENNEDSVKRTRFDCRGARRLFSPAEKGVNIAKADENLVSHTKSTLFSSPTDKLPNYIVDGTSPHHFCSRSPSQKENIDWLTKLQKEKQCVLKASVVSHFTPKRRRSSRSSSDGGILKFFRVSGKANSEQTVFANLSVPSINNCEK